MDTIDDGAGEKGKPTLLPVEPSALTYSLAGLVEMVRGGRVRVPHFQRGLRWGTADAVALVDSVLRGFPIGSLLLWKRPGPAEQVSLGDVRIDAPDLTEALYVVDGQQRITAFINAFDLHAGTSGPFSLVYDIRERPFKVRARRAHEHDSIPLPTVFDLNELLKWTRENPQYLDLIDEVNRATTRLREFRVPAYEVRSNDTKALRDIYDRMNNAGKRLSRAEAFWGLFAPEEERLSDRMSLANLRDHVDTALTWGQVDDDTILRVFLARRGHDVTRDIHLEFDDERRSRIDFPGESEETAHRLALEALERAVIFLRDVAGVPHFTFLAYRYLLVVLARFFAHFPSPDERNVQLLKRWYWRAAISGPSVTQGSATGAMRFLAACVRPGDEDGSVQSLLEAVSDKPAMKPNVYAFRSNHAASHIILCAMWARHPRIVDRIGDGESFFTATDLAAQIESGSTPNTAVPEIFDRKLLPENLKSAVGNRIIAPGLPREAIEEIIGREDLFAPGVSDEVRDSHFIPAHAPFATRDGGMAQFVEQRTEVIGSAVREFVEQMAGDSFDDSPPLSGFDLDDDDNNDLL